MKKIVVCVYDRRRVRGIEKRCVGRWTDRARRELAALALVVSASVSDRPCIHGLQPIAMKCQLMGRTPVSNVPSSWKRDGERSTEVKHVSLGFIQALLKVGSLT